MIQAEQATALAPVVRLRMARSAPVFPPYFTAAYWVDGLLVDSGCAHSAQELTLELRSYHVEQVANTHSHEDHIGANADVQETFDCPVRAHSDALPILADPRLQPLQAYRRFFWGWPRPSHGERIGAWVETEKHRFQVIHTPGHSPNHVCLLEPEEGWLFSGDAYIGGRDRVLRQGYDIVQIISSLQVLAKLPVSIIFPGSGTVRENGTVALIEKVMYLEELGERIHHLHEQGLSAQQIRQSVLGREPYLTWLTRGHFSGTRLVRSFLGESARATGKGAQIE